MGSVQPVVLRGRPRLPSLKTKVQSSQPSGYNGRKCEGAEPEIPRDCHLTIGSVNIGLMSGRSGEVVEMVARRRLDFCCIQESRWKGEGARLLGGEGKRYKFFWKGCKEGTAGVGIFVAEQYIDNVVEVRRVSERVLVLRVTIGKGVLNLVTAYAPQVGRSSEEKEEFCVLMGKMMAEISESEKLVVIGDMNGHVGERADGFECIHGGMGFGERNLEGEMLLEFAEATDFIVGNTWFKKEVTKRVTYQSGECRSQIDYVLV